MPIHKHQRDGAVFDCAVSFSTLAASAGAPREHGLAMLGTPGDFAGTGGPCSSRCEEGLRPSGSKSSDLAPSSLCGGAPPLHPGSLCRAGSPYAPLCRRSALHPGDFPVAGKVTKGAPRAVPFGIPRGGRFAPPAASRNPLDGGSATAKDRFATLSLWANRSLLFHLALTKRNLLLSIRGAGASRGRCGCTFVCNF